MRLDDRPGRHPRGAHRVFSLYGMRFKWIPELEWHYGDPAAVSFTIVACFLLYKRLQKTGWI